MIDNKSKIEKVENFKTEEQDQQKSAKNQAEQNPEQGKRAEARPESRMMNFFNQEFIERKIDFKPKYQKKLI